MIMTTILTDDYDEKDNIIDEENDSWNVKHHWSEDPNDKRVKKGFKTPTKTST